MSSFRDREVAGLSCCTHEFCTPCILQWSRTENSCPLCKQRFTHIVSLQKPTRRIAVPHRNQRSEAGRVLDTLLQSLHGGGDGIGIGLATTLGGPWMVHGDGATTAVELEDFLRRFFVSVPPLRGHSAETAIEIAEEEEEAAIGLV
jgi:Ring finger domain